MFAGIGGFRSGLTRAGGFQCVGHCEIDKYANASYYRAIQQGFEANGLPVESLEEAWNRTIDEVWSGKVDKSKDKKRSRNRKPER